MVQKYSSADLSQKKMGWLAHMTGKFTGFKHSRIQSLKDANRTGLFLFALFYMIFSSSLTTLNKKERKREREREREREIDS
jgi:hypothetical protein